MKRSNCAQPDSCHGGPAVGRPSNTLERVDASPVSWPIQYGLDALSARKCGMYAESALTMAIAFSAAAHADVHVDAEDLHLPRRPLHLLDEAAVAVVGGDLLVHRVAERVRARAHQQQVAARGVLGDLGERGGEVGAGLGDVLADPGDDLDRRLQQLGLGLGVHAVAVPLPHLDEQLVGALDELARLRVDDRQLHLDAEAGAGAGREVDRHATPTPPRAGREPRAGAARGNGRGTSRARARGTWRRRCRPGGGRSPRSRPSRR